MKLKFILYYIILALLYYSLFVFSFLMLPKIVFLVGVILIYTLVNVLWLLTCMKIGKITSLPYLYIINLIPFVGNLLFWVMEVESKKVSLYKFNNLLRKSKLEDEILPYIKEVGNSNIQMLLRGEEFFEILNKNIQSAKSTIYMDYYILRADETGVEIINNLKLAAQKGVNIYIMYDPYGSTKEIKQFKKLKKIKNIQITSFIKGGLFANLINIRNHLKMMIFDEQIVVTGGSNIGNEYNNKKLNFIWDDHNALIQGNATFEYSDIFKYNWKLATGRDIVGESFLRENNYKDTLTLVVNQPNTNISPLLYMYLKLLNEAKEKVVIYTPYFAFTESLYEALFMLSLKKVEIEMFIGEKPDHTFVYSASKYAIERLLNANIKVYRVNNTFVHTKLLLVDNKKVFIGNGNFDIRSCYYNYEINFLTENKIEIEKILKKININKKNSVLITKEIYDKENSFIKRAISYFATIFSRLF